MQCQTIHPKKTAQLSNFFAMNYITYAIKGLILRTIKAEEYTAFAGYFYIKEAKRQDE